MLLYHGSDVIVEKPEIRKPTHTLDFGMGFYATANKEQAITFANIVYDRNGNKNGSFVNVYDFDETLAKGFLDILEFEGIVTEWFDFVYENRRDLYAGKRYDLIIGAVANDTVYKTLIAFENGIFTKEETIARLKVKELYNQYVFGTKKGLSYLNFIKYDEVMV